MSCVILRHPTSAVCQKLMNIEFFSVYTGTRYLVRPQESTWPPGDTCSKGKFLNPHLQSSQRARGERTMWVLLIQLLGLGLPGVLANKTKSKLKRVKEESI